MRKRFFILFLTAIITSAGYSQGTTGTSGLRNIQPDNSAELKVNLITSDAGRYFKQGLLNLIDNRRPQARADFDKSVEVFLLSNVDVRKNQKLQSCYNQLIETVYLFEFPSQRKPQLRDLSLTCGWEVNQQTIEAVAKLSQAIEAMPQIAIDGGAQPAVVSKNSQSVAQSGFSDQTFEASPLDELAKLELTVQEQDVESTPEVRQQYEMIQVAVNRGSLGFAFQVHPMIQQFVNYYRGRGRVTMETGLYRSGMFMRMARRIFREEGVPENVAWLGQVESAWKPTAASWAAAKGLWQFIPGTGARYGLRINGYLDERSSFEKATRASARYLKFLANRYNGNWELAMGAYNCGEGNVDRAISRAGQSNFWAAYPYLPRETRNYVPNILATILIANNPHQYGFGHIRPAPQLQYDQVRVPSMTNLSLLAQASDTTVEYLRYLNPELRQNVSPPEPYIIRVPAGKANQAVAVLRRVPSSNRNAASVTNVAAGESYQNVANRTGVSVEQLQATNGAGSPPPKVVVPASKVQKTSYSRPTTPAPPPVAGVRTVKAQSGDTLAKIAARYGLPAVELAKFNGISSIDMPLAAGREIKIPPR